MTYELQVVAAHVRQLRALRRDARAFIKQRTASRPFWEGFVHGINMALIHACSAGRAMARKPASTDGLTLKKGAPTKTAHT